MAEKIRVTMDVSPEFKKLLERLANQTESGSQSDVIRRAIALYEVAVDAKTKGQAIALVNDDNSVATRIIGIGV